MSRRKKRGRGILESLHLQPRQSSPDEDVARKKLAEHLNAIEEIFGTPGALGITGIDAWNEKALIVQVQEVCAQFLIRTIDDGSPWIKATKGPQDLASNRTPCSLMTSQQNQSA